MSRELKLKGGTQNSDILFGGSLLDVKPRRFTPQQKNSGLHVTHGVEVGRGQTKTSPTECASSEPVPAAGAHSKHLRSVR